ncbi:complement factor H-like [Scomber scombrus]|uniref:complement factor H-like n=1 Tax=Scomber scombrus TaxID=13677 RepID=UPI002DD7AA80|nr:complement factor H-like [Scomber scombrus]
MCTYHLWSGKQVSVFTPNFFIFWGRGFQQSLIGGELNKALHSALWWNISLPSKMCIRYIGFLLLILIPDLLHAQSAKESCHAPQLDNGYFETEQESYRDEESLNYACDEGHKPVVEGWWATSICKNGTWSHEPQCIDEKACSPPNIPHAEYNQEQEHWHEDGFKLRVSCQNGYEHKDRIATTVCSNGAWSPQLVCERKFSACDMPPKIPHAVIIHQEYQDVFSQDSVLQYECEEGFTVEGVNTNKTIICIAGIWTSGPQCSEATRPSAGRDESTVGGGGGGHTSSAGSTGSGSTVGVTNGGHTTSTQPTGRGSSTTSGMNDRNSGPSIVSIKNCGTQPVIQNSVVVQKQDKYLKYKCVAYHTLVGLDTVVCYSDGSWSQTPVCKESFCLINPDQFAGTNIKVSGSNIYMEEGERKYYYCTQDNQFSLFECTNQQLSVTDCCLLYYHDHGWCQKIQLRSG